MSGKVLLDNDIVAKITAYDLADELVSILRAPYDHLGVLGTLVFAVSPKRLHRAKDGGSTAHLRLKKFVQAVTVLEPTANESRLAVALEEAAQQLGVDLDVGESQLAAIAMLRSADRLYTGDKRAIVSLESLRKMLEQLATLDGKIVPLEAVALAMIKEFGHEPIRSSVCASHGTDLALEVCFQCHNAEGKESETLVGIESYLGRINRAAPNLCGIVNGHS
jgi:hypothetical protein